jgi:hypothetical protein
LFSKKELMMATKKKVAKRKVTKRIAPRKSAAAKMGRPPTNWSDKATLFPLLRQIVKGKKGIKELTHKVPNKGVVQCTRYYVEAALIDPGYALPTKIVGPNGRLQRKLIWQLTKKGSEKYRRWVLEEGKATSSKKKTPHKPVDAPSTQASVSEAA